MATFKLTKDADVYEFDALGEVKKGGADFGAWTTNKSNQIVAKGAAGAPILFNVRWKFADGTNQLTLRSSDDKELFNFHKSGLRPFYAVSPKAVLQVFPDENGEFSFELRGQWDLNADHDLSFTIDGAKSVINGHVDDPKSRFTYFFFDKDGTDFNLVFVGQWIQPRVDESGAKVEFQYATEDKNADNTPKMGAFALPGSLTIDRSLNQFVYDYDKDNKRRRIKFMGLLSVTKDFQLVYSLDRQTLEDGGVATKATEFRIGAVLSNDKLSGDLEFILKRTDTDKVSKSVVGLKGHFTTDVAGNQLQLGFAFLQVREGQVKTTTFAIEGKLILKNNLTAVSWEFAGKDNVKSLTLNITDVQLGDVTANARLVLTAANGKQKRVTFLLGINF
jgi:hypothetical protein